MTTAELLGERVYAVLARVGGDPAHALTADPDLERAWAAAEPEARAAVLLEQAWQSRAGNLPAVPDDTEGPAGAPEAWIYADALRTYAQESATTAAEFYGPAWPLMPLPGPAGALASGLGFDRDDIDVSLGVVLLLAAAAPPK